MMKFDGWSDGKKGEENKRERERERGEESNTQHLQFPQGHGKSVENQIKIKSIIVLRRGGFG